MANFLKAKPPASLLWIFAKAAFIPSPCLVVDTQCNIATHAAGVNLPTEADTNDFRLLFSAILKDFLLDVASFYQSY